MELGEGEGVGSREDAKTRRREEEGEATAGHEDMTANVALWREAAWPLSFL